MILIETQRLSNEHLTETHELTALNLIEQAVYKATKVFEQKIYDEEPSEICSAETDRPGQ